jgi:hypothetical protein
LRAKRSEFFAFLLFISRYFLNDDKAPRRSGSLVCKSFRHLPFGRADFDQNLNSRVGASSLGTRFALDSSRMWNMKKFAASIILLGALLITGQVTSEQLNITENLRHERVVLPASTPDRSRMAVVQTLTFLEEELGAGMLVFYDDARTKRQIDYIELYDLEGDLLVVSWIDRLGTCQVAMDRGLLDPDDPSVDGVLITVAVGTML